MTKDWNALTFNDYPHQTTEIIRFSDIDALGHVNNAVFATYLEAGHAVLTTDENGRDFVPGTGIVLAQLNLSYLNEMTWPGTAEIGTGIERFGRSSFTIRQAIFQDGVIAASAEIILVMVDLETRSSMAIPDELREILAEFVFEQD